jgi:hypothetical protein
MWDFPNFYASISKNCSECKMQLVDGGFNKFKMDDSTHVKMLIILKMWKDSLNDSNIIVKHWIACVLLYHNKWKM